MKSNLPRPVFRSFLRTAVAGLASGLLAMLLLAVPGSRAAEAPEEPAATNRTAVLLVTGVDYPGHVWRQTAPVLRSVLERDARLLVTVVEDPHFLDSARLTNYAAVVLHFQNWQVPGPGPAARENLRRHVERGGGLVLTHFACGAWYDEWPEFQRLAGRAWFGPEGGRQHDPHGRFTVKIRDPEHPITRGLGDFETADELYTCLAGDVPIRVLATARSVVDQRDYPMAFVLDYGRGRVFHSPLGHDVAAFSAEGVGALLRRGTAWAAGISP